MMTGNKYQELVKRTMKFKNGTAEMHAIHGMIGEIGEVHSLFHRVYQGHDFDEEHAKKELGNLLWFIAEYCTAMNWCLEDVMQLNINKLMERYPEGFEAERSLHRAEGDI